MPPPSDSQSAFPTPAPELYSLLRSAAAEYLRENERDAGRWHTLQPTAIVHEALMRLAKTYQHEYPGMGNPDWWREPAQFFALCTSVMRRVLIDHARAKAAAKRTKGQTSTPTLGTAPEDVGAETIERIQAAINDLRTADADAARIVELRFYLGLTIPQAARALGGSISEVERDWRAARAWLKSSLGAVERSFIEGGP